MDTNHSGSMDSGRLEWLLDQLDGVRSSGSGWSARCPAHEDRTPSLSVSEGEDGCILLHCHAGCPLEEILTVLGIELRDLFPEPNGHEPEAVYQYVDEQGGPLFEVVRLPGKKFRQRRPDGSWGVQGVRKVLYRLPRLPEAIRKEQTIYVVEGEKDVQALEAAGAVATCNGGGAGKWKREYAEALHGARVVVVADRDEPGRAHAEQVRASLDGVAASVQVAVAKEGKDAYDHLAAGHGLNEFELASELEYADPRAGRAETGHRSGLAAEAAGAECETASAGAGDARKSAASAMIELVEEAAVELFHDEEQRSYATFKRDDHQESWPLRSRSFKLYLRRLYHEACGQAANAQALTDALATLEAKALFKGATIPVYLRVAGEPGVIYIDLCDSKWRAVRVTATGWQVVEQAPVRFRRTASMAPLPVPTAPGSLEKLRRFVNFGSEDDFRLLVGWLLAAFRPPGQPYPLLALHGEQGSAKSTTARIVRQLIDPSTVPLRAAPRDVRDLMVTANACWLLSLDNLSQIQPWLSDALCRLATGGGFATRELYTDSDEVIFDAQRPVVVNGIEELATRSDLLDRAILLTLPPIHEEKRRLESELWRDFEAARPQLFAGLLDALAAALASIDSTHLEAMPRMADFALWVTAAEPGLGWQPGAFVTSYTGNRGDAHELALEASPIGQILGAVVGAGFRGTASELLELLALQGEDKAARQNDWPRSPQGVSGLIRRLAPNLRPLGWKIETFREPGGSRRRIIELSPPSSPSVPSVPSVPSSNGDSPSLLADEQSQTSSHEELVGDAERDDRDDRDNPWGWT